MATTLRDRSARTLGEGFAAAAVIGVARRVDCAILYSRRTAVGDDAVGPTKRVRGDDVCGFSPFDRDSVRILRPGFRRARKKRTYRSISRLYPRARFEFIGDGATRVYLRDTRAYIYRAFTAVVRGGARREV